MNDTVTVTLVVRAPFGRFLRIFTPMSVSAELRVRRKNSTFNSFKFLSGSRHESPLKEKTLHGKSQIGAALVRQQFLD